jgi:CubicO group peptidase (beta-lactamase class C family)
LLTSWLVLAACGSETNGRDSGGNGSAPMGSGGASMGGGGVGGSAGTQPNDAIDAIETNLAGVVEGSLEERMAFHSTPGVSVSVIEGGAVAWSHAWGMYDISDQTPLATQSLLQAASISKPTTAVGILRLVDQGLLTLDEPISTWLTSWQVPSTPFTQDDPVTLRRVLSHTAGFNLSGFIGYPAGSPVPNLLEVLTGTSPATNEALEVVSVPGTVWRYSGGGYTSLAQVAEDVTGESFATWMATNVLQPLGMTKSTFAQPIDDPEIASAQIAGLFGGAVAPFTYPELPAAGLWSTAPDLARLVLGIQAALAGASSVITRSAAVSMITPQSPSPFAFEIGFSANPGMGLGLFLSDGPDPDWFWHTGSNTGFMCIIVGDTRGRGQGVAVMTNAFPGGRLLAWEIVNAVADLYAWPAWGDWGL